jgi:uncharacterized protein YjiS (DUF1127 family)
MNGQKDYALVGCEGAQGGRSLSMLRAVAQQARRWWQLHEQRRRLAVLDDVALKDLGLSRADVMQESERPFWSDPLRR